MKSGFVSILGRPNVGKSTILNGILNQKVSIVTDKSQTTRNNIKGIYTSETSQIVFVDTPGIHKPHQRLGEEMNTMAYSTAHDVDVNILVVDASEKFGDGDLFVIDHADIKRCPLIIVFNKIDLIKIDHILKLKQQYKTIFPDAIMIESVATEKFNLDEIIKQVENLLPEGPVFYSKETVTDKDEVFMVKEIIREKLLKTLRDEVPHSCAVFINNIEWELNPMPIEATIVVEKDSQKGIVIGAGGKKIKYIGTMARKSLEAYFKKHIYLDLKVSVEEDWRNQSKLLDKFGYINKK